MGRANLSSSRENPPTTYLHVEVFLVPSNPDLQVRLSAELPRGHLDPQSDAVYGTASTQARARVRASAMARSLTQIPITRVMRTISTPPKNKGALSPNALAIPPPTSAPTDAIP